MKNWSRFEVIILKFDGEYGASRMMYLSNISGCNIIKFQAIAPPKSCATRVHLS
jgi:hypothetical protein